MKNAMKKLMSLVLVAMILVSAVPFAASADTTPNFWIEVKVDGETSSQNIYVEPETEITAAKAEELARTYFGQYFTDGYEIVGAYDFGGKVGVDGYIGVGFELKTKVVTPPAPTAYPISIDVDGEMKALTDKVSVTYEEVLSMAGVSASDVNYVVYEGDAVEGTRVLDAGQTITLAGATRVFIFTKEEEPTTPPTTTPSEPVETPNGTGSSENGYHKLSGTVTLRILMKGTNTYKDIAIKTGIAADGKVTLAEVKSVVNYYYNSIDTDTGILVDGIYIDDSVMDLWMSYAHDEKYDTILGLYDAAYNNNDVRLTVVIDNAKLASTSSSNADTTNPKTGDSIMMPVAIMTVTASMLAVAFFFNKKRAI